MFVKYIIVCLINFLCTYLILKILNFVLPCNFTSYYFKAAELFLFIVVSSFMTGYTKKILFSEKIRPERKAVLITGCARGIGNLTAKRLDSEGFHVFASCRNIDSPGADDLRKSCSSRLKVLQLDVTKDESVDKAVEFVKEHLGTCELWAIINNAGIQKGFLIELSRIQDFQETIEVNAISQVRVTKAFLPLLRKYRGRVINMASCAGRLPMPMCASYTMSKYAAVGFSESIRLELDMWGIKVISIEPEFFETDMTKEENIMMRVEDSFSSAKEEIRKDYGEEFLKTLYAKLAKAIPPSPKIHKVIDDIVRAVTLKDPDIVYRTCRNVFMKHICYFLIACPTEVRILISNCLRGFSKPKKTNKIHES